MPVRLSDRWLTPGVLVALILCGTLLVLAVAGGTVFLTWMGRDPAPLVQLVGTLVAAVTGAGTLLVQLVGRATAAKTERNTGVLASAVYDVRDAMPRPPRHAYPETVEAAPRA